MFVDPETETAQAVKNTPGAHGAGVQAAQIVASNKATVVITGNVSPNAYQGLSAANIEIYVGAKGSGKDTLDDYNAGRLSLAQGPTGGAPHGGRR